MQWQPCKELEVLRSWWTLSMHSILSIPRQAQPSSCHRDGLYLRNSACIVTHSNIVALQHMGTHAARLMLQEVDIYYPTRALLNCIGFSKYVHVELALPELTCA